MADAPKKSKGGSKLARSEITTVRLDPKLRYLAELAARKQRRTLSSFIEWAIEDSLGRFNVRERDEGSVTLLSQADKLWDVDEADRFAKLAFGFPELMTHDEQLLWKLLREHGGLWHGRTRQEDGSWTWNVTEGLLNYPMLRTHWTVFKGVASGDLTPQDLPDWIQEDPDALPS